MGVQIGKISRFFLGSPGTKSHLDVGVMERRKEYYIGEGGDQGPVVSPYLHVVVVVTIYPLAHR